MEWTGPEARVLIRTQLLTGLPAGAVSDFLALACRRRFRSGERLFTEGEPGDGMFLPTAGKVKVTRPGQGGKDILFTMVGPGELLGELSVLDGLPRHATATAVRETGAAWLAARAARSWLAGHPEAAMRMMGLLTTRVRRLNDRLEDAAGVDVATRVARALLEHGARFGRSTAQGTRLTLDLSQDDLALHVHASRERVNQVLMDFCRRGWLVRDDGDLIITGPVPLTARARYRPEAAARRPSVLPRTP